MKPNNPLKHWLAMTIPASAITGLLAGGWHAIIGKDIASGMVGGFLGIACSFPLIGLLHYAFNWRDRQ